MAVINSINCELGAPRKIADLEEDPEAIDILLNDGWNQYREAENLLPLMIRCLEATLAEAELGSDGLGFVFFVGDFPDQEIKRTFELLMDFNFKHPCPIRLGLAGCTTMGVALRQAALLADAADSDVLVVGARGCSPGTPRIYGSRRIPLGALSDATVSCIVSQNRFAGYKIGVAAEVGNLSGAIRSASGDVSRKLEMDREAAREIKGDRAFSMFQALRRLVLKFEQRSGRSVKSYRYVVTQNINSDNQRAFLNVCGMDQHALVHPTKADCGHMIVADLLMNIRQITEMDEPFLSFLHSPSALQLIEMSAIEPK